MYKIMAFDIAREMAEKHKLAYGISVTDGYYYVGTQTELELLPVVIKFSYERKEV